MPLIIEDGTGVVGSNCYVDVAFVDAYWADRNDPDWVALAVPEKEQHIILGAQYIDNAAVFVYDGIIASVGQFMAWPRENAQYWRNGPAIPSGTIPTEMRLANAEAAWLSFKDAIPTQPPGGGSGSVGSSDVQSETVGEISVSYFDPARPAAGGSTNAGGSGAEGGILAFSDYVHPRVGGIVQPILDQEYYEDAAEIPGTTTPPDGPVDREDAYRRQTLLVGGGIPLFAVGLHDTNRAGLQLPRRSVRRSLNLGASRTGRMDNA